MKAIVELWAPVLINGGIFKDDYFVSNLGRVKKKHLFKNGNSRLLLVKITNGKRPMVKMSGNGKIYNKSLAKLVLSSFHYRKGCECANITYLDGNMKNCELSNLRYTADKDVYTAVELENKEFLSEESSVQTISKERNNKKSDVPRSCSTCRKNPCFDGMATLNTDFGAVGCRKYKSKEEE